ncbi:23782_t:CDS:1, partial [Gigaspora rosea]
QIIVNVITKNEARKIIYREQKATKYKNDLFQKSKNEKLKKQIDKLCQNEKYV